MPRTRHTLIEAVAARLGWRRTYRDPAQLDLLLTEQSETAYAEAEAADHAPLATAKNCTAQHVQPGVLDVRGLVLADVLFLEGVLTGARNRNLEPELLELLAAAVDHGHELTLLLANTARTTAAVHTVGL